MRFDQPITWRIGELILCTSETLSIARLATLTTSCFTKASTAICQPPMVEMEMGSGVLSPAIQHEIKQSENGVIIKRKRQLPGMRVVASDWNASVDVSRQGRGELVKGDLLLY